VTVEVLEDQFNLVETNNYPDYSKFPFEKFNPVQSRIFEIFKEDCNLVVAAKTSAGKTICSEMVMAHEIREKSGKAMYLAPLKALAKEKIDDWTSESHHFADLNLSICTGDYRLTDKRKKELEDANIIIMTSEMLNSRCRNNKSESNEWLKNIGTIVLDEAHLLTVGGRGDHLEVGLMKLTEINPNCRIVALSATMPNVDEISEWLNRLNSKKTFLIDSKYRPCPLNIHYHSYEEQKTYDLNEESKIDSSIDILREYKDDKFLVFVHTKKLGYKLKKDLEQFGMNVEFHNADLNKDKRQEVESRFKNGDLRVIIATSTLAWGLNLPARRVIIAGVHRGMSEVDTYDVAQMAGRAGRVGFDPQGDVYILVPGSEPDKYVDKFSTPQNIESQLLKYIGQEENPRYKTLAFHLVSEIHHGNIKTIDDIHEWYERSLAYFQSMDLEDTIADNTIELLLQVGAIKQTDGVFEATSIGKVSSMFYYSPFDVADLRRNFRFLFANRLESNDVALSVALGNIDSIRMGFVSRTEAEEMEDYHYMVRQNLGNGIMDSAVKGGYIYYCLLNGLDLGPFSSLGRLMQFDFERTATVLNNLDSMAAKWNKRKFFNEVSLRVSYGVKKELIGFCKLPDVGKVRAQRLYAAGFRSSKDLVGKFDDVKKALNMKDEKISQIIQSAEKLS